MSDERFVDLFANAISALLLYRLSGCEPKARIVTRLAGRQFIQPWSLACPALAHRIATIPRPTPKMVAIPSESLIFGLLLYGSANQG